MQPRTTSHAIRVQMIERHLVGEPLEQIARSMQLSLYTVRKFWRRYHYGGWSALLPRPAGPPQRGILADFAPRVKYVLLRLKLLHPGWGVDKLLLELSRRASLRAIALPRRSSVSAYLSQFRGRLNRPRRLPTRRPPPFPIAQPSQPHQCWQIDFTGDLHVAGCQLRVLPFMVCDVASGAPLAGLMHRLVGRGNRAGVTTRSVQADLRQVFGRWGLPDTLRMDRDPLFVGSPRLEWPGTLLLWLIGLGITPLVNRPARPTDNAIVERNHQTFVAHVLQGQDYADLATLQQVTDAALRDRREYLPSRHRGCERQPPLQAFPSLAYPRRRFDPQQERSEFDLRAVDEYLSQWEWRRSVDSTGKISLANHNYRVGQAYQRQVVKVTFDPHDRCGVCRLADERVVARLTLEEWSVDYILGDGVGATPTVVPKPPRGSH